MSNRIRCKSLENKLMSADEAVSFIKDGMVVGMSGFTRAGDAKLVPEAMVRKAADEPFKITLITGASLGYDTDKKLCNAGILARRMPFQVDTTLRKAINNGEVMFMDNHLSETAEYLRNGHLSPVDCCVIEAVAITEDGGIVPTTSVGNSANFAKQANMIIVELNTSVSANFEGLHDIYTLEKVGNRKPIEILDCDTRIGETSIKVDLDKIVAIVMSDVPDSPSIITAPDNETQAIADHCAYTEPTSAI